MATNPYSYGSLGARWTVGEPTSKSLLDISRVKNDANRWVLEQLLTDPDDSTTGFGLLNGVTATTQSPSDNSTKVATTAYADAAASASATPPGGANTQIQYNNNGAFGASSNLTFDGSTLTVTGDLSVAGNYTNSVQPAFHANSTTDVANATGDGTTVTVDYDTERFDQGSDFNTSTYTFTAPVTGKYQFNCQGLFTGLAAAHTYGSISLVTSNRTYYIQHGLETDAVGSVTLNFSALVDMDASDTAYVTMNCSGSTKTVTINGTNPGTNHFSGYLVC
jgi:hypothetical protein